MVQDRDAGEDEKQFKLSRFMPVLQEVLEDLATNSLPEHEYPYVSAPASNGGALRPRPHAPGPAGPFVGGLASSSDRQADVGSA